MTAAKATQGSRATRKKAPETVSHRMERHAASSVQSQHDASDQLSAGLKDIIDTQSDMAQVMTSLVHEVAELSRSNKALSGDVVGLSGDVTALNQRATSFESEFTRIDEARHLRWKWSVLIGAVLLAITLLFTGIISYTALTNRRSLHLIEDTILPGGKIHDANQAQANSFLGLIAIESDCRSRRAAHGLSAPADPTKPCAGQTQPDVYPGTPVPNK